MLNENNLIPNLPENFDGPILGKINALASQIKRITEGLELLKERNLWSYEEAVNFGKWLQEEANPKYLDELEQVVNEKISEAIFNANNLQSYIKTARLSTTLLWAVYACGVFSN